MDESSELAPLTRKQNGSWSFLSTANLQSAVGLHFSSGYCCTKPFLTFATWSFSRVICEIQIWSDDVGLMVIDCWIGSFWVVNYVHLGSWHLINKHVNCCHDPEPQGFNLVSPHRPLLLKEPHRFPRKTSRHLWFISTSSRHAKTKILRSTFCKLNNQRSPAAYGNMVPSAL